MRMYPPPDSTEPDDADAWADTVARYSAARRRARNKSLRLWLSGALLLAVLAGVVAMHRGALP